MLHVYGFDLFAVSLCGPVAVLNAFFTCKIAATGFHHDVAIAAPRLCPPAPTTRLPDTSINGVEIDDSSADLLVRVRMDLVDQ
ncbi:MAG: hypothetical protein ABSA83_19215, partial [Verrucomicrobiota bacterium]